MERPGYLENPGMNWLNLDLRYGRFIKLIDGMK
jgi:hypothetical protein